MALNRSRYVDRDFQGDAELNEVVADVLAGLRQWGGDLFISAARLKLGRDGNPSEDGQQTTIGYVVSYSSKSQLKGAEEEPDVTYGQIVPPGVEEWESEAEAEAEAPNGSDPVPQEA